MSHSRPGRNWDNRSGRVNSLASWSSAFQSLKPESEAFGWHGRRLRTGSSCLHEVKPISSEVSHRKSSLRSRRTAVSGRGERVRFRLAPHIRSAGWRQEGGGGVNAIVWARCARGDVLFMNGSQVNRPTMSPKEAAAPAEQPSSAVKGTARHLREHRKCRLNTRLFDGNAVAPACCRPRLRGGGWGVGGRGLLHNLTKGDVMELHGGKS